MISTPAVFVYLGPCARNNLGTHEEEVVLSFFFSSFGGPCDSGDDRGQSGTFCGVCAANK